jgi:hypothetical protein
LKKGFVGTFFVGVFGYTASNYTLEVKSQSWTDGQDGTKRKKRK